MIEPFYNDSVIPVDDPANWKPVSPDQVREAVEMYRSFVIEAVLPDEGEYPHETAWGYLVRPAKTPTVVETENIKFPDILQSPRVAKETKTADGKFYMNDAGVRFRFYLRYNS